jgi:hypothetical protein
VVAFFFQGDLVNEQRQDGSNAAKLASIATFLLKVLIGIFMVPLMALWQGLKFFRRHVYNKGGWWRDISGASLGIACGVTLAQRHFHTANSNWWSLAGFDLALAVYAYVYPALFWLIIEPLLPYLRAFLKNVVEFLRLLFMDICRAISWFWRKLVWASLCWLWDNLIDPLLSFIWQQVICRIADAIKWCWNTFWHFVGTCIRRIADAIDWIYRHIVAPFCRFVLHRVIQPLCRFLRSCVRKMRQACSWLWEHVIKPSARFVWQRIVVPGARFLWHRVLVPLWHFVCKCARLIRKAACWAYGHVALPLLRFVWRQIICRIGLFLERCWQYACRAVRWIYRKVVCRFVRWFYEQILRRVGRALRWAARKLIEAIRQLWNLLVIKPLRWLWKRIIFPVVNRIYQRLQRAWNFVSRLFKLTYYARTTTSELLSNVLALAIPAALSWLYIAAVPHLTRYLLAIMLLPALSSIPLAYVWGGRILHVVQNWLIGFSLAFSSAYLAGVALAYFVSLNWAIATGIATGIACFFVLYPMLYCAIARRCEGSRTELAILGTFRAVNQRIEAAVAVLSSLCVEVWIYLRDTIPAFLAHTWKETWNFIQRVLRHFGA